LVEKEGASTEQKAGFADTSFDADSSANQGRLSTHGSFSDACEQLATQKASHLQECWNELSSNDGGQGFRQPDQSGA
jgi:hypothetical protein